MCRTRKSRYCRTATPCGIAQKGNAIPAWPMILTDTNTFYFLSLSFQREQRSCLSCLTKQTSPKCQGRSYWPLPGRRYVRSWSVKIPDITHFHQRLDSPFFPEKHQHYQLKSFQRRRTMSVSFPHGASFSSPLSPPDVQPSTSSPLLQHRSSLPPEAVVTIPEFKIPSKFALLARRKSIESAALSSAIMLPRKTKPSVSSASAESLGVVQEEE